MCLASNFGNMFCETQTLVYCVSKVRDVLRLTKKYCTKGASPCVVNSGKPTNINSTTLMTQDEQLPNK